MLYLSIRGPAVPDSLCHVTQYDGSHGKCIGAPRMVHICIISTHFIVYIVSVSQSLIMADLTHAATSCLLGYYYFFILEEVAAE